MAERDVHGSVKPKYSILAMEGIRQITRDERARQMLKKLGKGKITQLDLEDFALLYHPQFRKDLDKALEDVKAGRTVSLREAVCGAREKATGGKREPIGRPSES